MRTAKESSFYGEDLAFLHNQHYSDFVAGAAPQVVRVLRAAGIRQGRVCDVGCGGGQLSASLLRAGYDVTGIDVSEAMIAIARKRAPNARFIHGSIPGVQIPACVAAVAVGEVFNYLRSTGNILRAFRNIFATLEPGGILLFDIKEPPPKRLVRTSACTGEGWAVIAEIDENPARQRLVRTIHSFRKTGGYYRRSVEVHELGIYPLAVTIRMLRKTGFTVRTFPGYGSYRLSSDRKVLLARKARKMSRAK